MYNGILYVWYNSRIGTADNIISRYRAPGVLSAAME